MNKNQIEEISAFAAAHTVISVVYLFGSRATGHEKPGSDVDLGVLFNQNVDGFARVRMETDLSNRLGKEVHIVDMRRSSPFLCHQIYKHGKLIYDDGADLRFSFRAGVIRDYLDTAYLREQRRASLYGE